MTRSIHHLLAVGVLLAALPAVAVSKDEAIKQDRQQIKGTWKVVALTTNGNKAKAQDLAKLLVVNALDGSWILRSEDKVIGKGTSTLDPAQKPKAIDFTVTDGEGADMHYRGIYKIGKKNRRMCFAPPQQDRPTKFRSTSGSNHVLVTYQRQQTDGDSDAE